MNNQSNRMEVIIAATFLSLGIAAAGFFISQTLYKAKTALNTADVKGLAERKVEADTAYWSILYTVSGNERDEIPELYKKSEQDQHKIISLLLESGFSKAEILPGVISYLREEYRDEDQNLVEEKHLLVGKIEVQTSKVKLVAGGRAKLNKLIAQGLDIKNNEPSYHFTQLNDIKPDMLKEATKNARLAANEFASNAGVKVGGIRSARQGGFIIRDAGKRHGDTQKIKKNVRVVTSISFYLTE